MFGLLILLFSIEGIVGQFAPDLTRFNLQDLVQGLPDYDIGPFDSAFNYDAKVFNENILLRIIHK